MANSGRRREGVLSTAPKFFKIIMDPPCRHTVLSGSALEVELVQSNGETLLQKGWQEFKERYSIGFGHCLVFEYNGDSHFDVLIFDRNASEINYPVDADFEPDQLPNVEDNRTESDNPSGRQQSRRKRHLSDDTIGFLSPNYHSQRARYSRVKLEESTSVKHSDGTRRQCLDRVQKQRVVAKETCIAYQKAVDFTCAHTSCNPFFISLMQPSYVSDKFVLNVPFTFVKENLPCRETNLTIRLTNGKAWSIKCIIWDGNAKLHTGWKDFVQDNALKVGDACIFEVAKRTKPVWNVIIFCS